MSKKLIIFAGLVLGIGLGVVNLETTWHGARNDEYGICYYSVQTSAISSALHSYKDLHGRYPSNNEGLSPVAGRIIKEIELQRKPASRIAHCRITASGVLTWWGDPIIYENRNEVSKAVNWPGGNLDQRSKHACKVDKGIYLWSVGAKEADRRVAAKSLRHSIITVLSLLTSTILLVLFILRTLNKCNKATWYIQVLRAGWYSIYGIAIMIAIAFPLTFILNGCCCRGPQTQRTPELTCCYTAILRSYRDQSVISSKTYDARVAALKRDLKDKSYYKH